MISNIVFAICVFATMYFLPLIIFKGVRGQALTPLTLLPFALGVAGMVLFFCGIY